MDAMRTIKRRLASKPARATHSFALPKAETLQQRHLLIESLAEQEHNNWCWDVSLHGLKPVASQRCFRRTPRVLVCSAPPLVETGVRGPVEAQ